MKRIKAIVLANVRASPGKAVTLLVGAIVLAVLLVRQFGGGPDAAQAADIAIVPTDTTNATASPVQTDVVEAVPVAPTRTKRLPRPSVARTLARDPFDIGWMGPIAEEIVEEDEPEERREHQFVLDFTMIGEHDADESVALISGVMVHLGQEIEGYKVTSISEREVTLSDGEETLVLTMR